MFGSREKALKAMQETGYSSNGMQVFDNSKALMMQARGLVNMNRDVGRNNGGGSPTPSLRRP